MVILDSAYYFYVCFTVVRATYELIWSNKLLCSTISLCCVGVHNTSPVLGSTNHILLIQSWLHAYDVLTCTSDASYLMVVVVAVGARSIISIVYFLILRRRLPAPPPRRLRLHHWLPKCIPHGHTCSPRTQTHPTALGLHQLHSLHLIPMPISKQRRAWSIEWGKNLRSRRSTYSYHPILLIARTGFPPRQLKMKSLSSTAPHRIHRHQSPPPPTWVFVINFYVQFIRAILTLFTKSTTAKGLVSY